MAEGDDLNIGGNVEKVTPDTGDSNLFNKGGAFDNSPPPPAVEPRTAPVSERSSGAMDPNDLIRAGADGQRDSTAISDQNAFVNKPEGQSAMSVIRETANPPYAQPATMVIDGKPVQGVIEAGAGRGVFVAPGEPPQRYEIKDIDNGRNGPNSASAELVRLDAQGQPAGTIRVPVANMAGREFTMPEPGRTETPRPRQDVNLPPPVEPPRQGGARDQVPPAGDGKGPGHTPPVAGTDGRTPPVAGTDGRTPPVAGTDGRTPPVAGTDGRTPPVAGPDGRTPPVAGTDGRTPPVAGTDGRTPGPGRGTGGDSPGNAGDNQPGRVQGGDRVAVPGDSTRGVRDASVLAQDLRAAETRFRGSDTQDSRAEARQQLEGLRREYADAVRQDPAYGARVQDAYRTLEGRGSGTDKPGQTPGTPTDRPTVPGDRPGVPGGTGGPGGVVGVPGRDGLPGREGGPRTSDGIPPGTTIPGRPGKEGGDHAGEPGRDAGRQPRDAGQSPSEILRLAGINLGDQKNRDAMSDILKKMDAGTLKPDQLDPNGRKILDALKTLDPPRLEQLRQLLNDLQTPGKQRPDDATIALKIKEIMDGGKDATDKSRRPDATELTSSIPKTATERLAEFMRSNKEILGQGLDSEKSKAALAELGKIVKDMNRELGLDPTKGGINFREIVARTMEGTVRPGEKGVPERTQTVREETLVGKLNPAQEAAFRAGMERGVRTEIPATGAERRPEAQAGALDRRAEVPATAAERQAGRAEPGRPEAGKPEAGRPDGRLEGGKLDTGKDPGRGEPGRVETGRAEAASQVPQKSALAEGREGKPGEGKPDAGGKDLGGKPDAPGLKVAEAAAAAAATKAGDVADKNVDPRVLAGRTDVTDKLEDDKKIKKLDEKERLEEEQQKLTDAQLAVLAARKAKEDKEREEKDKERVQENDKREQDSRRTKYVVKEKDTLESVAGKMLNDKRLAALILEINKTVIQVRQEQGKKIVELQPKMVIWLPSPLDIREFRGRIFGAAGGQIEYAPSQPSSDKALTPEEELAARFGGTAEDYKDGAPAPAAQPQIADVAGEAVAEMTAQVVAAAKTRRENVEKLLGPVSAPKNVDESGHLKYTVRLGDTLKSVAIKHPALQDVQLWKLLAEVNDLTTDTDAKGAPTAQLKRGTVIKVPPTHIVEEYRKEHNLKGLVPKASFEPGGATVKFDIATKPCPECSRMTTHDAEICPGCGHSFPAAAAVAGAAGKPQQSFSPQPAAPPTPVPPMPVLPTPALPTPTPQAMTPPHAPATPVPPKAVPKAPSMPGPLPRPGTVFDASPNPSSTEPGKSAGRSLPPPPIPRRKTGGDVRTAPNPFYEEPAAQQPARQPEPPRPEPLEPASPVYPTNFGPSGDESDFTRQLLGGMGFDPAPSIPPVVPAKPSVSEREIQGFIQQLGDACRMVKFDAGAGTKSGLKAHLEVRRSDDTWIPILTYEIYDDVSLRHEFTLDGKRRTIRIDLPPQAVQELAENDLTTNWQNYCQRFLSGRSISD